MNDLKKSLQSYIDYKKTYWYNKMKAFEHLAKEANAEWEKCFQENSTLIDIEDILKNEQLLDQLLAYESFGNFYTHAHNSFEYNENSYPKPYDENYENISTNSIKAFYDWIEKR